MDKLKEIIEQNRDLFDQQDLPEGFEERFMRKVDAMEIDNGHNRVKLYFKHIMTGSISIAALVLLFFSIFLFKDRAEQYDPDSLYENYMAEVGSLRDQIISISGEESDSYSIDRTIEIIVSDAIPLDQLLPEELSQREKIKILKDYYNQKLLAIKQMKILVSQSIINE